MPRPRGSTGGVPDQPESAGLRRLLGRHPGRGRRDPAQPVASSRSRMRSTDEVDVFEIGYDSLDGVRIAGWYCVPRQLPPAALPGPADRARLRLRADAAEVVGEAGLRRGRVAPRGKLRSNQQFNPGYPGLLVHNIVDRHTYAYRGFYVDAVRARRLLLTPARRWTSAHRRARQSSQGGALTITTAALRRDVITCGAAGAPYLCGFMDARRADPLLSVRGDQRVPAPVPGARAAVRETLALLRRHQLRAARAAARCWSISGSRTTSARRRPGYALCNALTCPKELHTYAPVRPRRRPLLDNAEGPGLPGGAPAARRRPAQRAEPTVG